MRIGIDCRLWNETGVGRYIRNLVVNLQKIDKRNEYVLFALSKDYGIVKCQMSNVKCQIIRANIRWHTVDEQLKFPKILKKENLDLVHFPYFSVPIFYNRPFVVTIHDLIINHFPTGQASTLSLPLYNFKLLGYKFVISQATKKAKKIITVSNATKKEIVDHLGVDSSKVVVTYEGVSLVSPRGISTKRYTLNAKRYFLYVGNAYPHKNLERLLGAFLLFCHPEASAEGSSKILRSAQNDIGLVFVGKEDYFYKRLKKKVEEMRLSDKVIFLHNVSDEELSVLYKNALALVLPSLMEGFGLTALEAMANKCLVLSSDIPSLKETCGNAATYFDPLNVSDIKEKLERFNFDDSNHRSNKIMEGLKRAKMFSWEKMTKETLEIYESSVGV